MQPDFPSDRVRKAQDNWRLFQEIGSSGDIWEIDESLNGICIGPDSDVARVKAFSYNGAELGSISEMTVSVGNPFEGRIDAMMGTPYPVSGTAARILVALDDLIDLDYKPLDWDPGDPPQQDAEPIIYEPPVIDLVVDMTKVPELPVVRSDREIVFSRLSALPDPIVNTWYVVPCYGRRFARALVVNHAVGVQVSIELIGVRLAIGATIAGGNKAGEVSIGTAGPIAAGASGQVIFQSSLHGLYDLLVLKATSPDLLAETYDVNIRFDLSDSEDGR